MRRDGEQSSPTSNLSPKQSSNSGDEAPNAGDAAGANSESAEVDKACTKAAILLTKLALARQSSDNISVVVIFLSDQTSHVGATWVKHGSKPLKNGRKDIFYAVLTI